MKQLKHYIYPIFLLVSGMVILTGCPSDPSIEEELQEDRFFDLYMGSKYPDATSRSSGLYYIEHREGNGDSPDSEDWVIINYAASRIPQEDVVDSYLEEVAKNNNFYDSMAIYGPYKIPVLDMLDGVSEGLTLMKEGGQSIMCFKSNLGWGMDAPSNIGSYQSLKYEVELLEVIRDIEAYEQQKIENFIDTIPDMDTIRDAETGAILHYKIFETTEGSTIANDSILKVAYTGYLIDGRVFDSRPSEDPVQFTIGQGKVIQGWDQALLRFREGESGILVIPYEMAYGEDGRLENGLRAIPPKETLVFEIEVVDVAPAKVSSDDED